MTAGLDRRAAAARILAGRGEALVVTGLGAPAWDVAAAGDDARNFYMWGGMGGAAMVGLGLAAARPARRVLVVTGDGEMLMGVGSLATIAVAAPANLAIVVIDNERYGETGMQDTHTAHGVDLARMAEGAGFPATATVRDAEGLEAALPMVHGGAGPALVVVKAAADRHATVLPPRDGPLLRSRFRAAVLGPEADGWAAPP